MRNMRRIEPKQKKNNIIKFKSAQQLAKDELFESLKTFMYDTNVTGIILIANYGELNELGTFTSDIDSTVEALGILELAKSCFRG